MHKQWIVAAFGVTLLGVSQSCDKKNSTGGESGPPTGQKGQIDTVNDSNLTSPVNQASGAAATKRPLPATQPSSTTQPSTRP